MANTNDQRSEPKVPPASPQASQPAAKAKLGAAAAGGAVAGAGALGLFTRLGLDKVIEQQSGYGAFYVLTIFSMVALVVLGTSYIVVQRQNPGEKLSILPLVMVGVFAAISLAGVALFGYDFATNPVISVPGSFQPAVASFKDPDTIQPIVLKAAIENPVSDPPERIFPDSPTPFQLRRDHAFTIKLYNLDMLENKYVQQINALKAQRDDDKRMLNNFATLCDQLKRPADDQVCMMLKVLVNGMVPPANSSPQ